MHELNHGAAGKGDKERSPGWRNNYDEIQNFKKNGIPGLQRVGANRFRKTYTQPPATGIGPTALDNLEPGEVIQRFISSGVLPPVPPDQNGDACGNRPRCGCDKRV